MSVIDLAERRLSEREKSERIQKAARLRTSAAKLNRMADDMKLKASDLERSATRA